MTSQDSSIEKQKSEHAMTKVSVKVEQTESISLNTGFGSTPANPFMTVTASSTEESAEKTEQKRKVFGFTSLSPTTATGTTKPMTTSPFFSGNNTTTPIIKFDSISSMTARKGPDRESYVTSSPSLFGSFSPVPGTTAATVASTATDENQKSTSLSDSATTTSTDAVNALNLVPPLSSSVSFGSVASNNSNKEIITSGSHNSSFLDYADKNSPPCAGMSYNNEPIPSLKRQESSIISESRQQEVQGQSTESKKRSFNLSEDSLFSDTPPSKSSCGSNRKNTTSTRVKRSLKRQTSVPSVPSLPSYATVFPLSSLSTNNSQSSFSNTEDLSYNASNTSNDKSDESDYNREDNSAVLFQDFSTTNFSITAPYEHESKESNTHYVPPQPSSPSGPTFTPINATGSEASTNPKDGQLIISSALDDPKTSGKEVEPVVFGNINRWMPEDTRLTSSGSDLTVLDSNPKWTGGKSSLSISTTSVDPSSTTIPASTTTSTLESGPNAVPNKENEGLFSAYSSSSSIFKRLSPITSPITTHPEVTKPSGPMKTVSFRSPVVSSMRSDSGKSSTVSSPNSSVPHSPLDVTTSVYNAKEIPNLFPELPNTSFGKNNNNNEKSPLLSQQNTDNNSNNNKATQTSESVFSLEKSIGEPTSSKSFTTDISGSKPSFSNILSMVPVPTTTTPLSVPLSNPEKAAATSTTLLPSSFSLSASTSLPSSSSVPPPGTNASSISIPNLPQEEKKNLFMTELENMAKILCISNDQASQIIFPRLGTREFQDQLNRTPTNVPVDNFSKATTFNELPITKQEELSFLERHINNEQQRCDYIKQRMETKQMESTEQTRIKAESLKKQVDVFNYTLESQLHDIQMIIDSTTNNLRHAAGAAQIIEHYKNPNDRSNRWLFGYASSDDYFANLSGALNDRLETYKRYIWEIERVTESWSDSRVKSPQEIADILRAQNQAFLHLSNKVARLNEMVRAITHQ